MLALAGLTALGLAVFAAGWVVRGWVEDERHQTIPDHPAIRRPERSRLRVVPPVPPGQADPLLMSTDTTGASPYDYEKEGG